MRASRLLSILNTLQAHGHATAPELAHICNVSLRTIYRDIDALSNAGIPVYSERGPDGGYHLLDGYRTRLNGLSPAEAQVLFLTGLTHTAADLGLDAIMVAAQNKLLSALPASLRAGAEQMRTRFHIDAPPWFSEAEPPLHLPLIADAVWHQRPLEIHYQSWKQEKQQTVEPLGLVLKSGNWYLIAQINGQPRTYRISRISKPNALEQHFERPTGFDLAHYWQNATRQLEARLYANQATIRFSPWGLSMLKVFLPSAICTKAYPESPPDPEGWQTFILPVGCLTEACTDLLRFGADAEVLSPPGLRARMSEIATRMIKHYAADTPSDAH